MTLVISSASVEYVRVAVKATVSGVDYDPTADVVKMAFIQTGTPVSGDWKTASWETDVGTGVHYARCLVGTDAILAAGTYTVWVKVTDSPEVPVKQADVLVVT